jgi:hypothetical protein
MLYEASLAWSGGADSFKRPRVSQRLLLLPLLQMLFLLLLLLSLLVPLLPMVLLLVKSARRDLLLNPNEALCTFS